MVSHEVLEPTDENVRSSSRPETRWRNFSRKAEASFRAARAGTIYRLS
jgi:hypothetical protein